MQVEIQLVGKPNRWLYNQRRIRIGRDSSCDVSLTGNEYPMVSREHVVLEIKDGVVGLSDPRSGNGTFLNGQRVNAGSLRCGDVIRLGADGPELQIRLIEGAAQTIVAPTAESARTGISGEASTRISTGTSNAAATVVASSAAAEAFTVVNSPLAAVATVVGESASTRIVQPKEIQSTVLSIPDQAAETPSRSRPVRIAFGNGPGQELTPEVKSSEPQCAAKNISEIGDEQVIERKLNSIRTLLAANLAVMIVLLLGLFYVNQQIERNRKDLSDMRVQAQTAVGQFTPELDFRLNSFDKRMDAVDGKMKDAEDRLVVRMNKEIPTMLDKYVDQKLDQAKRNAAIGRP
jgi:pSer/pThr/pTyr-binding forkhead associated (FHA) protein